jgi:hypothetical protein
MIINVSKMQALFCSPSLQQMPSIFQKVRSLICGGPLSLQIRRVRQSYYQIVDTFPWWLPQTGLRMGAKWERLQTHVYIYIYVCLCVCMFHDLYGLLEVGPPF